MTAQTEADLSDKSFITAYALHAEDSITWRMAENQIRYHLLKGGVILCFVSQSRFEMGGDSSFLAIGIGNAGKAVFQKTCDAFARNTQYRCVTIFLPKFILRHNELWGQIDYVLYVLNDGVVMRTILGGEAKLEQTEITDTDEITALLSDFTYVEQHGKTFPPGAEYAVKWIRRASAVIGGKEVAIEAKQDLLASLNRQLEKETASEKRQVIIEQISATETAIQELYTGTSGSEGLYALMRRAVLLAVQRANTEGVFQESLCSQQEIEQRFAEAMGDMLRDGYWSNTSYAPGQESLLFLEATEIMET